MKSENGFDLWEIRPKGESGFHRFPFYCLIGKSEKRFAKLFSWTAVFFLLIMHAHARPLFLRTVCQILFRISQSNGTKEIQKHLKSKIRILRSINPDFPIDSTLKKRNIAMWSAQYDRWKKKTDSKPYFTTKSTTFLFSYSHLHSRNLLEITATNNITKSA